MFFAAHSLQKSECIGIWPMVNVFAIANSECLLRKADIKSNIFFTI